VIRINLFYDPGLLPSYEVKAKEILSNGKTDIKSIKNHPLK
jgi:hypothetical protein